MRKPELGEGREGRRELPFATVNEYQIGLLSSFLEHTPITPQDDFPHRCKVVGSLGNGLDLVLAMLAAFGLSIFEDHHRCHDVATLDVGDVEAFDAAGLVRQVQKLAQSLKTRCSLATLLLIGKLEGQPGIPTDQIHHAPLATAARHFDLYPAFPPTREPLLNQLPLGKVDGHMNFGG